MFKTVLTFERRRVMNTWSIFCSDREQIWLRGGGQFEMAKFILTVAALIFFVLPRANAHEALLSASCRQNTCTNVLIRSVEPILFLKQGMVRRYEASYLDRRCDPEDEDHAKCQLIRPQLDEFKTFSRNYALCSLANPTVLIGPTKPERPKDYIVRALDIAGDMGNYATSSILEYLVVCHGWEPKASNDITAKSIAAFGYKPATVPTDKILASEAEALALLKKDWNSSIEAESINALQGKWYSNNVKVSASSAYAQISGKYYDTEFTKGPDSIANACKTGADTIVEFIPKSIEFHENSCAINKVKPWPQSKTTFDYFVKCIGGNRNARLIIEKQLNDRIWIQWDDNSPKSKTAGAIYQKCPAIEATSQPADLPKRIGDCHQTTISNITDRFGNPLGSRESSGTIVYFANGGRQVSYENESSIARSKIGDRVNLCLMSTPKNCPPGDERGKVYNSKNLRTEEAWTLSDAAHVCGGA
jgi:hypothetical protein